MHAAQLIIWDEAGCRRIHDATLEVLAEVGVEVTYDPALEFFASAGAHVDGIRVRIPAAMVAAALESAPREFLLRPNAAATRSR